MTKKVFGLVILAALIIIVIVTMVKNNMDQEKSIDNEQLGTEMTGVASSEGLNKGNSAPDFELTTLDGKKVKLSDYQGKKVILNFWATWCPPCKAEMPHMQNYYEDFAEQENVEILAVNLTSGDSADKVEDFVRDYGLTFPIPMDVEGSVAQTFEAITIPTSYMIDTKGRIQNKIVGPMDDQMIEDFVSKLE